MSKARVLSCTLASLVFIALLGCSDSGQGTSSQTEEQTSQTQEDGEVNILASVFPSPKEQNPYSVENMSKTFKSLVLANNPNAKDIPELEANFLYVRFLPYGKQGEYELKTYDTSLVLFKHPMDYNEIRKPVVYVDKTLPDSIIPYFASVPVGYEFGSTPYEILQELFLTQPLEEDEGDYQEGSRFVKAKKANKADKEIAAYLKNQGLTPSQLEMAAFPSSERFSTETGSNSNKALAKSTPVDMDNLVAWSLFPSRWRPSGILKFMGDSSIKYTPKEQFLVGVRVTAGYSFYWRSSRTDNNGYFQSPERWTWSVDYEVNFDQGQFLLQDGNSWYGEDLEIEKNNKKSAWVETFTGNHAKWCVIWTAAYNYWYGSIYGLERPRQNSKWNQSLEINVYKNDKDYKKSLACLLKECKYSIGRYINGPLWEYIMIQIDRTHIQIYGSTIHEIAHSSNYYNMQTKEWNLPQFWEFDDLPLILRESYARGIQRYLTSKRYNSWDTTYTIGEYTGVFEDLEDTNTTFAETNKYCDRVSGITVPMAEKSLFKSTTWDNFKTNLKSDYPNGTPNGEGGKVAYITADMNALFKYWETGDGAAPCPVPITDARDKKVYRTTIIGTQTWMAENLNYNVTGSKCYYDITSNCDKYGRLYDWTTALALPSSCSSASCQGQVSAKHRGICPAGWHIPSMEDWNILMRYVDNVNNTRSPYDSPKAGIHLKAESGWSNGGNGKDTYGFSAFPSGGAGYNGDWWSTAEYDVDGAYRFDLYYGDKAGWSDIGGSNRRFDKASLYSIRCVKD